MHVWRVATCLMEPIGMRRVVPVFACLRTTPKVCSLSKARPFPGKPHQLRTIASFTMSHIPHELFGACAELRVLGDTRFVNRVNLKGRGTLSLAHRLRPDVLKHMLACGANPRRQGSDWFKFLSVAGGCGQYVKAATIIHTIIKTGFKVRFGLLNRTSLSLGCQIC